MSVFSTWLTVNRACNLACKWCYAQEMDSRNNMNISLAKKLVDISTEIGVRNFKLIGGEPTIYPNFFEILEYIMSKNIDVIIVTNGLKLANRDFCQALQRYHYSKLHLGISIKGGTDEDYFRDCGVRGFSRLVEGLKNCEEFGLNYSLSYVLTQENIVALDSFAHNLVDSGISKTIFMAYCNYIISENDESQPIDLQLKMDYAFAKKYDIVSSILSDKIRLHETFPLCMCEPNTYKKMLSKGQVITTCHVHKRNGLIFDTDGSVLLCNHLAGYGLGKYGRDFNDSITFLKFWNSDYVVELYKKFTMLPSLKCKDCKLLPECGGGCFVQWFTQYFDEYEKYRNQQALI